MKSTYSMSVSFGFLSFGLSREQAQVHPSWVQALDLVAESRLNNKELEYCSQLLLVPFVN